MSFTLILLSAAAIVVSMPALVLGCECLLAMLPLRRDRRSEQVERPSLAVVVPAHNEEAGIAHTIDAILPQLTESDRLIVIADNCVDQTAAVARDLGATVLERVDDERRGKGYAIRYALDHLAADPPQVVVSVDADCLPLPGCVERVARAAHATGNPMQAAYIMQPPNQASPGTLISAFAVIVKNYVRPRGLQRIGMPCLITGSGIAYPWSLLRAVPHPESHIVEDMHYSVDLALAGHPPLPCMEALVESPLPDSQQAARTQRTRWEHGHLSVIQSQGPRLLLGALRQRSLKLLVMWLELVVPPLSLLVFAMVGAGAAIMVASWLVASWLPIGVYLLIALVGILGLSSAWWRFGRRALPAARLLSIPQYVLGKLSIYTKFVSAREQDWVRTARDAEPIAGVTGPHYGATETPAEKTSAAE
ncbi:MAG: glycosyltransferase family 2 protein [Planctomycetota bacterium]